MTKSETTSGQARQVITKSAGTLSQVFRTCLLNMEWDHRELSDLGLSLAKFGQDLAAVAPDFEGDLGATVAFVQKAVSAAQDAVLSGDIDKMGAAMVPLMETIKTLSAALDEDAGREVEEGRREREERERKARWAAGEQRWREQREQQAFEEEVQFAKAVRAKQAREAEELEDLRRSADAMKSVVEAVEAVQRQTAAIERAADDENGADEDDELEEVEESIWSSVVYGGNA